STGAPAAAVEIYVLDANGDPAWYGDTAADGSYNSGPIPSGAYTIEFSPTDSYCFNGCWQSNSGYATAYYPDASAASGAQSVWVAPGADATGFDASLVPDGDVSGVLTAAGTGVALPG